MGEKRKQAAKNWMAALLFMLPFLVLYTTFTIWPVVQGIYVSLHKWGIMGKISFLGLDNYEKMIGERFFWESLGNTTTFVAITVPLMIVVAMGLALLANRASKLKKFYRCCYYIPNVLSVSVISYLTVAMASPYVGFVNGFLHLLGLPQGVELLWLQNEYLVWLTLGWTTVWWTAGFSMLLYLSALQEISQEVYEAADIDGASKTKQLLFITIPLLKPTTYLVLLLQIIASYKVFGQIFMITRGGPGNATRPLIQYIYETAFTKNNFGYGAAMSYALFVILIILTVVQLTVKKRGERA